MGSRRPHTSSTYRPISRSGEHRNRTRATGERAPILLILLPGLLIMAAACSREATHRVLTFLYDGVPPLDAGLPLPEVEMSEASAEATEDEQAGRGKSKRQAFYSHPAYRNNLCGGCHDVDRGRLLKTAREGLCQTCHPDKPPKRKFVHGPVATNGCLACHLYHKSRYPKVLITDAQSLCFRCHVNEELTTDKHHATIKEERCVDCHDAHGGDDRFFLLPGVGKDGSRRNALIVEQER